MALLLNTSRQLRNVCGRPATILSIAKRCQSTLPRNVGILFVPQQEAWVVERMGRYLRILRPGLNIQIPFVDKVKYVQSLKEIAIEVPQQSAITVDNVHLQIDAVLYLRVIEPFKASYGVEDPEFAITQLAQTTMRSEVGKITLDTVFRERESLNVSIVSALNNAAEEAWGIKCLRYEIRDMKMPPRIQEAMQMQVEAERKKRAAVLESEGIRQAEINVAEGRKQSAILSSEGIMQEQINKAKGEASAIIARAEARAKGILTVAGSLHQKNGGNAASLQVAEQYVQAFSGLAQKNNTLILPTAAGDPAGMVAQAMSIYKSLMVPSQAPSSEDEPITESPVTQAGKEDLK
jgi:regulator of protease activity HflC (stomatin/prohibitin superfamily)